VKEAESNLAEVQSQIQRNGYSDMLRDSELRAQAKLDDALQRQDWFWHEKSKVNWHVEGDRNTSYFHRVAKIKNTSKVMFALKVDENLVIDPQ
jgi:hypothetical protein